MGLVRLDKIGADTHVLNVKATEAMVNGNVAKVGSYAEFDVFSASKPTALTDNVVFIAEQFISKHPLDREESFAIKANDIVRAYMLKRGDVITVTKDLVVAGSLVKDQFVTLTANGYGLTAKASVTTESLVFIVDDVNEKLGGFDAVVLRVEKAFI